MKTNSIQVHYITLILGIKPKRKGSGSWGWVAENHNGKEMSLYYTEGKNGHGDFVEIYDPENVLGLNTLKLDDVVNIRILDIPQYFKILSR